MLYLTYLPDPVSATADPDGLDCEFAVVRADTERLARETFIVESHLQEVDHDKIVVAEIAVDATSPIALVSGEGTAYLEELR